MKQRILSLIATINHDEAITTDRELGNICEESLQRGLAPYADRINCSEMHAVEQIEQMAEQPGAQTFMQLLETRSKMADATGEQRKFYWQFILMQLASFDAAVRAAQSNGLLP